MLDSVVAAKRYRTNTLEGQRFSITINLTTQTKCGGGMYGGMGGGMYGGMGGMYGGMGGMYGNQGQ